MSSGLHGVIIIFRNIITSPLCHVLRALLLHEPVSIVYSFGMSIPLAYALISVLAVSLLSLVGAFTFALRDKTLKSFLFVLVSVATGALFGDAFIHLLPEAFSELAPEIVSTSVLVGIGLFFILEKFLRWRHSHGIDEESQESEQAHDHSRKHIGVMVIVGDGIHNLIDGVIIGASFLVSIEIGIATTLAVVLHEIPQEIGDFGLLLHAGFSKKRALLFNLLSAALAFIGVFIVFAMGGGIQKFVPIALAFAAGGFIYIAGSDLLPEINRTKELKPSIVQVLSLLIGVLLMAGLLFLE